MKRVGLGYLGPAVEASKGKVRVYRGRLVCRVERVSAPNADQTRAAVSGRYEDLRRGRRNARKKCRSETFAFAFCVFAGVDSEGTYLLTHFPALGGTYDGRRQRRDDSLARDQKRESRMEGRGEAQLRA